MEQFTEGESTREEIKNKLRQNFDGKIVRKDLTKKIKEGANVPVYVLEFLLGQYCCSDDESVIEKGVQNVKHILADNFVCPDESQEFFVTTIKELPDKNFGIGGKTIDKVKAEYIRAHKS